MGVKKIIESIIRQNKDNYLIKFSFPIFFLLHYSTKKIFGKGICRFPKMNLELYGSIFETRKNTVDFWTVSIPHEKEMTKHLMKKKEKGTLIDVGTHIGRYSILMANKGWKIHSFEPVKSSFNQLKKNAKNNDVEKRISFYNLSIGEKKEEKEIYYDKTKRGEASLVINSRLKKDGITSSEKTKVNSLDNLFKDKIGGKVVLKIDVEGFEYEVLKGSKNFIQKNNPEILIEIWNPNKRKTEKFLKDLGYRHRFSELWTKK